jgi:phospholipase/carboxylesterase
MLTRRGLLALGLGTVTAGAALAQRARDGDSVLRARPRKPTDSITPGEHVLGLGSGRDGVLVIPRGYSPDKPAPLVVMLHGAGGGAQRIAARFSMAGEFGAILLVPDSRAATWDAIRGSFGPDVEFVNRALDHTFARCAVDGRRLAISGFSDGASYALSLGLDNGTLFTHLMAFSPGFIAARRPAGRPRIFISHGRSDHILPIDVTSRRVVPELEAAGYAVSYKEFDGPHTVPDGIARDAFTWFAQR